MNQHLARLKTHLINENQQQTDITDRRSFVSSVRTQAIPISNISDLKWSGLGYKASLIKLQQLADERNRSAEIMNSTNRFCFCGVMATLEWLDPVRNKRIWRCVECGQP